MKLVIFALCVSAGLSANIHRRNFLRAMGKNKAPTAGFDKKLNPVWKEEDCKAPGAWNPKYGCVWEQLVEVAQADWDDKVEAYREDNTEPEVPEVGGPVPAVDLMMDDNQLTAEQYLGYVNTAGLKCEDYGNMCHLNGGNTWSKPMNKKEKKAHNKYMNAFKAAQNFYNHRDDCFAADSKNAFKTTVTAISGVAATAVPIFANIGKPWAETTAKILRILAQTTDDSASAQLKNLVDATCADCEDVLQKFDNFQSDTLDRIEEELGTADEEGKKQAGNIFQQVKDGFGAAAQAMKLGCATYIQATSL
eukprot:g284.t1